MAIYELTTDKIRLIEETTFEGVGLRERGDLQRLLRRQIDVVAADTLVVAEEFGEWEDSRRRIDLLGLDKDANLVVFELKRDEEGGHMELQAVRYAAMVSAMTFEKVVDLYSRHLRVLGVDGVDARAAILDHLGWDEPDEDRFAQDVRVVLVAANFSKELTTSVIWLNKRGLDIRCVRIKPYRDDGRLLVDVQQVVPLPEAAEYQVQIREKEQRGQQDRAERYGLRHRFWTGLLERARSKTPLHANLSPSEYHWLGTGSGLRGLSFNYVIRQGEGTVELYIDRGEEAAATNKRLFDQLCAQRDVIEAAFGGQLDWERLDGKRACRIGYTTALGGYRSDETVWPTVQNAMVDAMIRLERALSPQITKLRAEV